LSSHRRPAAWLSDLTGDPGFSGSHDKTIALVEALPFQVGALNSSVWDKRVKEGKVDPKRRSRSSARLPTTTTTGWQAGN
jgi:phosphonate transport system substrate-binding protein